MTAGGEDVRPYHIAGDLVVLDFFCSCEQILGCRVEIASSYGMREYTLLVRPDHEP
jgi:hypothetical protein